MTAPMRPDVLDGGLGQDTMLGEAADDLFHAHDDSDDVVNGGLGRDTAYVDRIDKRLGIEVVRIG